MGLETAAGLFKGGFVRQRLQQNVAMDELLLQGIEGEHGDLVSIAEQFDVIPVRVLDDLIVPEKTGFRHGTAWGRKDGAKCPLGGELFNHRLNLT
ncbi:hypothetical protein GCM10023213_09910 [Prosthecobacter algae]|uniref:Uncharacterized protein n=1 Tax=Prosthecobacter algae TaxID=1144682 RepID=A0ABP9P1N2_9BACT